ncbi:MAG: FAD-dependent oxidoreductase, partial [Pseudomonadota bacterium]
TKLKYAEQVRVFRMIPGLENAEFARLGGLHRNTFLNSPRLLDGELRLRTRPHLRFAGQITGVEGYIESAACGLIAGRFAAAEVLGCRMSPPPATTALGALLAHITGGHLIADARGSSDPNAPPAPRSFQPMNINFGLMPPMAPPTRDADGNRLKGKERGRAKKRLMARRALDDLDRWLAAAKTGDMAAA